MKRIAIILCLFVSGCSSIKESVTSDVIEKMDSHSKGNVRLDGIYIYDGDSLCPNSQEIYFYGNNLINLSVGCGEDSFSLEKESLFNKKYGYMQLFSSWWGVYSLDGDTINAIIYTQFWNYSSQPWYRKSYYRGVLVNGNTIIDWRMVEPYPKFSENLSGRESQEVHKEYLQANYSYVEGRSKPVALHFMKSSGKQLVDSNKVWLNKYRSEKK